jgi:crossover junction endodeoxyribonuclease RusA
MPGNVHHLYLMLLYLPYPPSINHYYRTVPVKTRTKRVSCQPKISKEGRTYRQAIVKLIEDLDVAKVDGRIGVRLQVHPPDHRRRDLDNVQKPLLDALKHAGMYEDDSQIDWLLTERMPVTDQAGMVVATIEAVESRGFAAMVNKIWRGVMQRLTTAGLSRG